MCLFETRIYCKTVTAAALANTLTTSHSYHFFLCGKNILKFTHLATLKDEALLTIITHPAHQIPRTYSASDRKFVPSDQYLPIFPHHPLPLGATAADSHSSVFWRVTEITLCLPLLCLTYLTYHNAPKVHPCCHQHQDEKPEVLESRSAL